MIYLLTKETAEGVEYLAASPTKQFCENIQDEQADALVNQGYKPPRVEEHAPEEGKATRIYEFKGVRFVIYAVKEP